jgi:hypothetical protein
LAPPACDLAPPRRDGGNLGYPKGITTETRRLPPRRRDHGPRTNHFSWAPGARWSRVTAAVGFSSSPVENIADMLGAILQTQ